LYIFKYSLIDFSNACVERRVLKAIGDKGTFSVINPYSPHLYHRITVKTANGKRREKISGESTYHYQLRAFRDWITCGVPMPTDAAHGVANMLVIDAAYLAEGLPLRGSGQTPIATI
jgi:hypothetical protein